MKAIITGRFSKYTLLFRESKIYPYNLINLPFRKFGTKIIFFWFHPCYEKTNSCFVNNTLIAQGCRKQQLRDYHVVSGRFREKRYDIVPGSATSLR